MPAVEGAPGDVAAEQSWRSGFTDTASGRMGRAMQPPSRTDFEVPEPLSASIELSPRQILRDAALLDGLPATTRVYILDTGATDLTGWVQAAQTVRAAGLEAVPHIAARRIKSAGEIEHRIAALTREAGVRDMLVIAGGTSAPQGPFDSSIALLETGVIERHGLRDVGIAGHPEGSPDIPDRAIEAALDWKLAWAARAGVKLRLVTQFSFNADAVREWIDRMHARGIALPVHIGIAGPTGLASLLRYAALCGVKASAHAAVRRGSALSALVTSYTPEPFAHAIEWHAELTSGAHVAQLHVFPFGGLKATADWLIKRGSWEPRPAGTRGDT